jgi:hypothetical protein
MYDNAKNALGYTMFYYASDMYSYPNVRMLSVDGVAPTRDSIASGEYPFITYYYAVLRRDTPEDHPARAFLSWLRSTEGQRTAHQTGYVTLEPTDIPDGFEPVMYPGATLENTTVSSGTGGTEPADYVAYSSKDIIIDDYDNNGRIVVNFENGLINDAVNRWQDDILARSPGLTAVRSSWSVNRGLLSCAITVLFESDKEVNTAVFDMTTGQRLSSLSDLFYDGFNYIKYINENVPTAIGANARSWITDQDRLSQRPFTGYPTHFSDFYLSNGYLRLYIGKNDPFFHSIDILYSDYFLEIPLPADISPYGSPIVRYEETEDINGIAYAVPVITGSFSDEAANKKIRALADEAGDGFFSLDFDPGILFKAQPHISFWGDNMSVIYFISGSWESYTMAGEGFESKLDKRIDINLRTGEDADPVGVIPQKWWETHIFYAYENVLETPPSHYTITELDYDYTPSSEVRYENIIIHSDGLNIEFFAVEPDGERVLIRLNL